jgi:hypothetical protein
MNDRYNTGQTLLKCDKSRRHLFVANDSSNRLRYHRDFYISQYPKTGLLFLNM